MVSDVLIWRFENCTCLIHHSSHSLVLCICPHYKPVVQNLVNMQLGIPHLLALLARTMAHWKLQLVHQTSSTPRSIRCKRMFRDEKYTPSRWNWRDISPRSSNMWLTILNHEIIFSQKAFAQAVRRHPMCGRRSSSSLPLVWAWWEWWKSGVVNIIVCLLFENKSEIHKNIWSKWLTCKISSN